MSENAAPYTARPLRFRVWDGDAMSEPASMDDLLDCFSPNDTRIAYNDAERPVLMQSTGLRDADGREVFEGDRVRVLLDTYTVQFERGAFLLRGAPHFTGSNLGSFHRDDVEVVGNVYEGVPA